jgi:hypothetical protein
MPKEKIWGVSQNVLWACLGIVRVKITVSGIPNHMSGINR